MTGYNMPFGATVTEFERFDCQRRAADYDFDGAFEKFHQWSKTDRESAIKKGREIVRHLCAIRDYPTAWEVVAEIEQLTTQ